MELIDTHCHLAMEPLAAAPRAALRQAEEGGVAAVITAAVATSDWDTIEGQLALPGLYAVLGVHPYEAGSIEVSKLRGALAEKLGIAGVVGVGEVGLDAGEGRPAMTQQLAALRVQLELARERDLPLVLHCHRAHEPLLALLRELGGPWRGVVHGFARGPELARRYLDLGFCIGLGGRLLDAGASKLQRTASELPLDRLLLETDAPSAAWGDKPGGSSRPADLPEVAARLAALRGASLEEVARQTTCVARAHFRLPLPPCREDSR